MTGTAVKGAVPGPWRVERWSGGENHRKGFYVARTVGDRTEWLHAAGKLRRFATAATADAAAKALVAPPVGANK